MAQIEISAMQGRGCDRQRQTGFNCDAYQDCREVPPLKQARQAFSDVSQKDHVHITSSDNG